MCWMCAATGFQRELFSRLGFSIKRQAGRREACKHSDGGPVLEADLEGMKRRRRRQLGAGRASPSNDPQVVVVVVVDLAILFNFLTVANRTSCWLANSRDHPKRSHRCLLTHLEQATSSERITSTSAAAITTTDSPSKGTLFELLLLFMLLLAELFAMENEISDPKLEARGARQVFSAQH